MRAGTRLLSSFLPCLFLTLIDPAQAGPVTLDLSAEASRPAANDRIRATLFAEATSPSPGESARRVNAVIAEALSTIKAAPGVRAQTAGTHAYPVYARGGSRIESWRMRSEILVESGDPAALPDLLGKLQASLGIASIAYAPSTETRRKAEEEAIVDAIAAFRERARIAAGALGKDYRIRHLSLGGQTHRPPMPVLRAAPMVAAEAMPMPLETGESTITVNVGGQIELVE